LYHDMVFVYVSSRSQEVTLFSLRQELMLHNKISLIGNIYDGTVLTKLFYQSTAIIKRILTDIPGGSDGTG